jgi:hypothetical protein
MTVKNLISNLFKNKKKDVLFGLNSDYTDLPHRALLYYKTESLVNKKNGEKYDHTNLWEITEIVAILNRFGFIVDVVDRSAKSFEPENIYDIYIGIGSGNSGKFFAQYAKRIPDALTILYATGTNPLVRNQLGLDVYRMFHERTGIHASPMRLFDEADFNDFINYTDYIFCIGEEGIFSFESYKIFGKSIFPILPGTSPKIRFSPNWLKTRKRNHFLCFAGNGFIHKGVDVITEAFLSMPECHLIICGPDSEKPFFEAYGDKIAKSSNIHYKGFLQVGGVEFEEICSRCSFSILYSSSEGLATSIASTMRAGLIPVVNPETSIPVADYGVLMSDKQDRINDIIKTVRQIVQMSDEEYGRRVYATLIKSLDYTQSGFTMSFSKALLSVMEREPLFHK